MSEEEKEIIKEIDDLLEYMQEEFEAKHSYLNKREYQAVKGLLDLYYKQQKKIKDWFEIADNILRATNDYGNITIGEIPKYIEKQQEEYNKRVSTIMNYEQGLKKIIDEEDDPDTWAYYAVQKLLKEVGGIDYE